MIVYSVYIITNKPQGVIYTGMTNNLRRRINQHKKKVHSSTFSARYNLDKLVYFQHFETKEEALKKERQIKKWNRDWKISLIEEVNPDWRDLYGNLK